MTTHGKDQEENLGSAENLSPDGSSHDLTCVGHVVYMRVGNFELANHVAGICSDCTEADDKYNTTNEWSVVHWGSFAEMNLRHDTDGSESRWEREDP